MTDRAEAIIALLDLPDPPDLPGRGHTPFSAPDPERLADLRRTLRLLDELEDRDGPREMDL